MLGLKRASQARASCAATHSPYFVCELLDQIRCGTIELSVPPQDDVIQVGARDVPKKRTNITYRWCVGLQRSDRAVLEHGIETGIIKRLPHGAYIELHQPLGPVDEHGHPIPLEYQGAAVPKRMNKLGAAGAPGSGSLLTGAPAFS